MKRAFNFKLIFIILFVIFIISLIAFNLYYLDKVYFLCPITYAKDIVVRVDKRGSGYFNTRRSGRRRHKGIDLLAQVGTPVVAARAGLVIEAKETKGMGKYVMIKHRDNLVTLYGHLSEISVHKLEMVRQGEELGKVGKSGNARYPSIRAHLHLEVRKNNIPEDPMEYLE